MRLPVSETSSKEACEGRDTTEVVVVKSTVGRDSMSPHQILHTEIVEGLVEREVGTGAFKDTLRGGYGARPFRTCRQGQAVPLQIWG